MRMRMFGLMLLSAAMIASSAQSQNFVFEPPLPEVTGGPSADEQQADDGSAADAALDGADGVAAPEDLGPYILKPGDVISINVLEDAALNQNALIRPDGRISLPLAGTILAAGKTPEDLATELQVALADAFLEPPSVTVALNRIAPEFQEDDLPEFFILGQVGRQGRFTSREPISIIQALSIAGGPGLFAAVERIQVRKRDEEGIETVLLFDYDAVEDGEAIQEIIMIEDGDVIFVPERGIFE
ncbi:MAG: polysaccharide biosynthesis/export family protein [Paracoccaceae bacterium]